MTTPKDPSPKTSATADAAAPQDALPPADPVVRWAEYVKAAILYPPESERVVQAFDAFREAVRKGLRFDRLAITMSQEELLVSGQGKQEIEEGSKQAWLRDRLRSGALDGVVFHGNVSREAMLAFTGRLSALHQRKRSVEPGEEPWGEAYEGIDLIHREFDGSFSGRAGLVAGMAADEEDGEQGILPHQDSDGLVDRLSLEAPVTACVARISEQLAGLALPGEIETEFGTRSVRRLLRYVVQCIPEDERGSYESAATTARSILGGLETMLQQEGQSTESVASDESVDLRALVYGASRMIFSRAPSELTEDDLPDRGRGHRGDEEVTDDLSCLLLEINGFPRQHIVLDTAQLEDGAEQLRVFFHYLVRPAKGERLDLIYDHATRLLQTVGEREKAAIRDVIQDVWHHGENVVARQRIVEFFTHAKQTHLLRQCGALPVAHVIKAFPRNFGIYLDGIRVGDPADRAELLAVVRALDPERVAGCEAALVSGPESLGHPGRVEALLGVAQQAVLPFVGPILALGDEEHVPLLARYLREVGRDHEVCLLFDVLGEFGRFEPHYLRDCAKSLMSGRSFPGVLMHEAEVLSRLIASKHADPVQRLRAIHALGKLGTNDARQRLRLLLRRRFWLFPVEPANVREAARSALAAREVRDV